MWREVLKCGSGFQLYKIIIHFPSECFKIHDTDLYAKLLRISHYVTRTFVSFGCKWIFIMAPVWILTSGVADTEKRYNKIIEGEEMGEKGGGSCDIVKSGSRSTNKRWPGLLLHIIIFIRLLASSFCCVSLVISGLAPCELVASRLIWPVRRCMVPCSNFLVHGFRHSWASHVRTCTCYWGPRHVARSVNSL